MTDEAAKGPEDGPSGPAPTDDAADPTEHRPDGLDLARSLVKGAGSSTTPPARKPRRRSRTRRRKGDPSALSGPGPDGRDPQAIGSALGRLVDEQGWALDLQVQGVFGRWEEIVGPEIAAHSTPESLTDGSLVVRTDSTAWATQLKLLAPDVVRRLNSELGDGTVTVVDIKGPHAPSWKHGRLGVRRGRGPRDTYG